jgi:A/G-specific adenine glycosylase
LSARRAAASARGDDESAPIDSAQGKRFSVLLRRWFRANGRDLPWRHTRDPYEVLISELMLQQTQVSRVITRYGEFLATFPTLHDVARARPKQVTEAWAGLGYYARARNLHALAKAVTDRGRDEDATLPPEAAALRTLPGIGAYTAGAVSSFAYERRAALVDTNVARVLRRVFAPGVDPKTGRGQKRLWSIARAILPRTGKATWAHNQALMELGALVCTARVMRCDECPVRGICQTRASTSAPRPSAAPRRPSNPVSSSTDAHRARCRSAAAERSSAPCRSASLPTVPANPRSAPRRRGR